jgi:hypothetical protein
MSVLQKISFYQQQRNDIPNQLLAKELAENSDQAGIAEIAQNLWNSEPNIQSDCLKVLYETGYLRPELVAPYVDDFLKLLTHRNNRLVWGAMIALATIAHLKTDELIQHEAEIRQTMEKGSVITVDNATKIIAALAAGNAAYRKQITPYLFDHLRTCRPADFPRYVELIAAAVDTQNKDDFIKICEQRLPTLNAARSARVIKVLKKVQK